jgi:Mce-associated membrane protein
VTSAEAETRVGDTGGVSNSPSSESAPPPAGAAPLAPRTRRALVVLAAVGLVLVVASVVLALVGKQHTDAREEREGARDAALSAARQAILNLDALSAATIDADLKRVLASATGSFKDEFSKAQADLKTRIVQVKTVSSGQVLSAGVVRSDPDTATVLVAVDRTVKDSSNATGVVAHDRWKLDLEKHGGRWLVADLQPVS